MAEPITWITKNGKHIPIYADKPTEDEQRKKKQIEQNENEASKKSGDRLDCGADPKALRQEMREKLLDKDSYMLTDEYQKLDDEVMKWWNEYNKLSDRRRELYKIQEENTTPDNSMKLGSNDYEAQVIAKMFGTKNDKAKAAEAELKTVRAKMDEADSKHEAAVRKLKEYEKNYGSRNVDEHTVSKNIKSSYKGFQLDTGTSHYQDLLKKGKAYIVEMSPKTYLQYCGSKIFDSTYEKQVRTCIADAPHTYALADEMRRGTKMYMPWLDFSGDKGQEGRHRAVAAILNNIDKIPVLIVR